jgi:short-subunit dehydrogenase
MAGHPPLPAATLYSATKAGIRAAATSLRPELEASGIGSLLVYPPVTDTAMVRSMAGFDTSRRIADPEKVGERIVAAIVAGRSSTLNLMTPAERMVAAAYHFAPSLVEAVLRRNAHRFAAGFGPVDATEGDSPCP